MKYCVLNSSTKVCENIIELNSADEFIAYKPGIELAPNQTGEIGWTWTGTAWNNPNEHTAEQKAARIRQQRDQILKHIVDSMSPMRWNALTDQQRTDWTAYRQALLDITEQETFPNSVTWPVKPE